MTPTDRSLKTLKGGAATATEPDIAQRAYGLYLARGCEDGHDAEDWRQAERELRRRSITV